MLIVILFKFLPDSTLVFLSLAISSISSLAGFGSETSPPKIELVAASADVVVTVWEVEAAPKADLLPPKMEEIPEVPPPNIKAESEVDPAWPNTDDEDVIVVVVVAVPPKTDGEKIGSSMVSKMVILFKFLPHSTLVFLSLTISSISSTVAVKYITS